MLTTGLASVDWITEQVGHTSANMIRQHYGMWINEDGSDVIGMLQHALGIQAPNGDKAPRTGSNVDKLAARIPMGLSYGLFCLSENTKPLKTSTFSGVLSFQMWR
nr:hypothetical protein FFPRI1PSEUD_21110 [Pseudomonas sp. FFPRI_1]